MQNYTSEDLENTLDYVELVNVLEEGFAGNILAPPRTHLDYKVPGQTEGNTLLLMPAIQIGKFGGVKLVNVNPQNNEKGLASIQGVYYLMDAVTGAPLATMDAKTLTNKRTAAASALASKFLSIPEASSLLMIGTGSLAPYLIDAHRAIRPIEHLLVYGRNPQKAEELAKSKESLFDKVEVVTDLDDSISQADIISAATLTTDPLIKGSKLREGQHIDLVGAFKPTRREADDEVMKRASIFCDSKMMAPKEAGDLAIPLKNGTITENDINADLFEMCQKTKQGRIDVSQITVFKSVGHALEDLVAAQLVFSKMNS